jgi:hypothetical protein
MLTTKHRKTLLRRRLITAAALLLVALTSFAAPLQVASAQAQEVAVYKSPFCDCCGKWVQHLRQHGFTVAVHTTEDLDPVKAKYGVPADLVSCHTAVVEGYVVEGHVPASDIRRLLEERPKARGLAVPGMPAGSPGMEGAGREPYEVLLFDASGTTQVFAKH